MTLSHENIFCITGPLWGEVTGDVTWASWRVISLAIPLFVQAFVQAYTKENVKAADYRPCVRGTHMSLVGSPQKEPVTRW